MVQQRDNKGRFASSGNGDAEDLQVIQNIAHMTKLLENRTFSRAQLGAKLGDPRRSINHDCGFPETWNIRFADYKEMYDRNPVADRVVSILPDQSWQLQPNLVEDDDAETETAFEMAWKELPKQLNSGSLYKDKDVNPVWEYLQRIDKISGIGRYGVLLVGVDDERELSEPAELKEGGGTVNRKLTYLRVFNEGAAQIVGYEKDKENPRYGTPTEYNLVMNELSPAEDGGVMTAGTQRVHWTRVIHVADNLGNSEFIGTPRQQSVFNNLLTLDKLLGGSGEMYWRGAFPGYSIETHPQQTDVEIPTATVKAQMEQFMNSLQRFLAIEGVTVNSLAPQVVSPKDQIEVQIDAICIRIGVPKRIFTGSERGDLASTQDKDLWNDALRHRQIFHITPRIVAPFADRLIQMRVLPAPKQFKVEWSDLNALNETVQSEVALRRTEAIVKYLQGGGENAIQLLDFFVEILGLPADKAEAIIDATMIELQEREEEEEERMQEAEGEIMGRMQAEASRQKQEAAMVQQGITP